MTSCRLCAVGCCFHKHSRTSYCRGVHIHIMRSRELTFSGGHYLVERVKVKEHSSFYSVLIFFFYKKMYSCITNKM